MARPVIHRPRGVTQFACVTLIALLVLLALFGHLIWGTDAAKVDPAHPLGGASGSHPFGTDQIGRDILARVLVASRLSVELAILAAAIGVVIGVSIGIGQAVLGPFFRRLLTSSIMVGLAFPGLLLALLVNAILGAGPTGAVLGVGIALIPPFARFSQTLASSAAGSEYVAAARVLGASRTRIMVRHILPNIAKPLILTALMSIGTSLVSISALSFLGLGIQSPSYDWGALLQSGLQVIYVHPMAAIGPGLFIVLAGLAFNLAGEAFSGGQQPQLLGDMSGLGLSRRAAIAAANRLTHDAGEHTEHTETGAQAELPVGENALLRIRDLHVAFPGTAGAVTAVRGVSLDIGPGERLGVVGESGCGKSTLVLALACLLTHPTSWQWERFEFDGQVIDLDATSKYRQLFGTKFAIVFQDPANSLNPALRVGRQLAELRQVHFGDSRDVAFDAAIERLRDVQIPNPDVRARQYPHEFSGGMRQRAMIASGLMGTPRLLVADEPTTALDVTVQAHVIRLLERINEDTGTAVLLISHDISVVVSFCSRVLVMYAGRVVEDIPTEWLLTRAAHPYTRALISAVPDVEDRTDLPLATIPGRPPNMDDLPVGCAFAARCPYADEKCRTDDPALAVITAAHLVACWHPRSADTDADVRADERATV
jgi:oligopeptide/dipeptide ABC transporter ATP-binding protein